MALFRVVDLIVEKFKETKNLKLIDECLDKFDLVLEGNLVTLLKLLLQLPNRSFGESVDSKSPGGRMRKKKKDHLGSRKKGSSAALVNGEVHLKEAEEFA